MTVTELYDKTVSRTVAVEIARIFFGGGVVFPEVLKSAYLFENGRVRLRVMREIVVPGQVHCGVEIFEKRVGYFHFDVDKFEMSPLWKDD